MTNEEKAEEYLRKGVCQGCSSICEGDCAYAKPVRQAYLDGLAEGRKEEHNKWCSNPFWVMQLENENAGLKKENEQLKAYESHWEEIEEDAKRIAEENAELKAQIEKMKCCGNCKHWKNESIQKYCVLTAPDFLIKKRIDKCDKWEPAE